MHAPPPPAHRCHRLGKSCSSQTPAPPRQKKEPKPTRISELERRLEDLTARLEATGSNKRPRLSAPSGTLPGLDDTDVASSPRPLAPLSMHSPDMAAATDPSLGRHHHLRSPLLDLDLDGDAAAAAAAATTSRKLDRPTRGVGPPPHPHFGYRMMGHLFPDQIPGGRDPQYDESDAAAVAAAAGANHFGPVTPPESQAGTTPSTTATAASTNTSITTGTSGSALTSAQTKAAAAEAAAAALVADCCPVKQPSRGFSKLSSTTATMSPESASTASSSSSRPSLWPQEAEAEGLLAEYRDQIQMLYPFVIVPPETSAAELLETRPFLWKAVMMQACHLDGARQIELGNRLLEDIGLACLTRPHKSLDLLQGLQILVAW